MKLLSIENISKSYSERILIDNISLFINEGDKIGIIGVNGTGKSTLLKILAGISTVNSGKIVKSKGVTIGYLPQNPDFHEEATVLQQVFHGLSKESQQVKEFEAKTILTKLGIMDFEQPVNLMSGGQKKRVAIAAALVTPCDVLILDEPTNHIDNSMVLWLEKYLSSYKGAIIMVTHDRYFLDRVTNRIAELNSGKLYSYDCNYSKYLELKSEREEMLIASERKRQSLLRTELEWIQRGARARGTKSKERIARFEELSQDDGIAVGEKLQISSVSARLGRKIIELKNISKSYNGKKIIEKFSYRIMRNDRVGIIGDNGCGKSTLLKIINSDILPDSGITEIGETVKIGLFSQECEEMDISLRVIDYIRNVAEFIETVNGKISASQMLERFLFNADMQWSYISKLSGGERRRLFLLRIIMDAPNVLLLDEPTNDLDIETLMLLEQYLEEFNGAVIVVTHDRYFLDKVADTIFAFEGNGIITQYLGGYTDYFDKSSADIRQKVQKDKLSTMAKTDEKPTEKIKFSFNEQREYDTIDEEIAILEDGITACENEIEEKSSEYEILQNLIEKKNILQQKLSDKTDRWLYLNEIYDKYYK